MKKTANEKKAKCREELKVNEQWLELARKLGTIAEDIVAPAIKRTAVQLFGFEDIEDFTVRRVKSKVKDRSVRREFENMAVCGEKVILNEVHPTPRLSYVEDFISFVKSGDFFEYFPEYEGKELISIFASLNLPDDIIERLSGNGIYAMGLRDSVMEILNFEECRNHISTGPE